jgi:hypothetical protein
MNRQQVNSTNSPTCSWPLFTSATVSICQHMAALGPTSNDTQFAKSTRERTLFGPGCCARATKRVTSCVCVFDRDTLFSVCFFFTKPWHWESGSKARVVMCCCVPATSIIDFIQTPLVQQEIIKHGSFIVRHAPARPIALMRASWRPFL